MKKGKTIWGLGLVIAGLLLFVDLLGLLPSRINWMTMTMSALVAAGAIVNLLSKKYANAIMLVTVGVIINRESLGIDGNIWLILFIGALLSIGVSLLLKDHSVIIRMGDGEHFTMGEGQKFKYAEADGTIQITSVFGSNSRSIRTDNLRYIKVESVMGSLDLYLNEAVILNEATIKIDNVFSKTRIYVNKDVDVVSSLSSVFGGVSEINPHGSGDGPVLRISGDNVFAGIEIIYI